MGTDFGIYVGCHMNGGVVAPFERLLSTQEVTCFIERLSICKGCQSLNGVVKV